MGSRSKKPRKKYNPKKVAARYVQKLAQKVYCYDGQCFPCMQFGGVNRAHPAARQVLYSVADDMHDWRIWIGTFESDGAKEWITSGVIDTLPKASSNNLNKVLDGELERFINQRNPNQVVSYGWFAIPMGDADLDEREPQIIDLFRQAGAFNKDHCRMQHAERMIQEHGVS